MPIVSTAQVSYLLTKCQFDMLAQEGRATLRKFVDGTPVGDYEIVATGAEFMTLVSAMPTPGKSRGYDIADAIYDYAITNRGFEGSIA